MPEKVQKTPLIKDGAFTVEDVRELAFFDLSGEKAGTQGTSNKSYYAEFQVATSGDKCQIYTVWGPTGAPHQTKEWRYYDSSIHARKDFEAILKSKIKKGYRIIDVAQRAQGSEAAKAIIKPVILKGSDQLVLSQFVDSEKLPLPTQNLIQQLFGATFQFVATTLKCPLGQLSNVQIDRGRESLNKAKTILNALNNVNPTKKQSQELQDLTNEFYGQIPHNLGQGARGQMTHLLFDNIQKVVQKEADLDTLWDAKSVGAVLNQNSGFDAQYKELNAELIWIDFNDTIYKFITTYFKKSMVSQHGYQSAKVKNIWKVNRKDQESSYFLENSQKISKECGTHSFINETQKLCPEVEHWIPAKRPDLDNNLCELFSKANTWLCWHGTRNVNVIGITKRGLLIRPAGATHNGSMAGDGKYFSWQSSKSLGYLDGGRWTGDINRNNSKFMFLLDVSLGNMHLAKLPHFYQSPPKGYHSVYGKAKYSGVMNDEMITYDFDQKNTQSRIRYLLEIIDF